MKKKPSEKNTKTKKTLNNAMDVIGTDLYNFQITGNKACSMNANSNMSANHAGPALLILNDMGGDIMSVSKDVTCTLRSQMKHHEPIICFEPGIAKREGSDSRFVADKSVTLRANMGDNQPAVVYAIEGNVVDRVSAKNGKGYCENVSPTLNTQDRHAICFQLCGDRDNPSVSFSDTAYCIPANPMSDRGQAVVYALEGNGARPSHMGTGFNDSGVMYTLNTIEQHSVCYGVDCRNLCMNEEKSGTLQAKNVGGFSYNFLNPVLIAESEHEED